MNDKLEDAFRQELCVLGNTPRMSSAPNKPFASKGEFQPSLGAAIL